MKNVQCRKLNIDRRKAPDKVGTLKDISLYGNFQFPTSGQYSGGLIARSIAGVGKELKKTKGQVQALASRSRPIAGSTGATTTEELCVTATDRRNPSGMPYSIRFIQHAPDPVIEATMVPAEEGLTRHIAESGYALKTGGTKRVTFTLAQKQVMMEFYNRQANEGIRADPADCIAAMQERRLDVLKESQIRSWWSSYHQKQKRENERLAANLRQLQGQLTSTSCSATAASLNGNNVPSTAPAATLNSTQPSVNPASTLIPTQQPVTSAATLNSTQPSVSSVVVLNSTQPSVSSAATLNSTQPSLNSASASTLIPTQQPVTSAATLNSTQPSFSSAATVNSTQPSVASAATVNARQPSPVLQIDLLGANIGNGVTEWYFPWNMSQSTIDNRNGSNACVFIAFNFGLLYKQFSLDNTLVDENLNSHWQTALENAIRAGNDIHDQLFDFEGVNVSVEEGIELAGEVCQVGQVLREYNVFGANPLDQLETVIKTLTQQRQSFHVLIALEMAMLIIVDSCGILFFIDSHIHGTKGAVIARFNPDSHCQAQNFAVWLDQMLIHTKGVGLSICSIASILYS